LELGRWRLRLLRIEPPEPLALFMEGENISSSQRVYEELPLAKVCALTMILHHLKVDVTLQVSDLDISR
jgi:hypothetical protein